MAENKNLDELNMLQNDGKIDTTQARKEDRKDVEAVARGKKTVDEAPQTVTVELLKEYSNKNKIFGKLESHCEQDGVDIYAYFIKCFNDKETVKVSDILDNIAKKIPTLIDTINDDKNNNLFIDGNGNIDIAASLKKARDNGRELPSYIQAIAQEAGNDEVENERNNKPLTNEEISVLQKHRDEKLDLFRRMNEDEDYKKYKDAADSLDNGNPQESDIKISKETYITLKFLDEIKNFYENEIKFENGIKTRNDARNISFQAVAYLKSIYGIDMATVPDSIKKELEGVIAALKETVVEFGGFKELKLSELEPENIDALIEKNDLENADAMQGKGFQYVIDKLKKLKTKCEVNYDKAEIDHDDVDASLNTKYGNIVKENDAENLVKHLLLIEYMPEIEAGIDVTEKAKKSNIMALKLVEERFPNGKKVVERGRGRFSVDENAKIKFETLKRICFEDFFNKYEVENPDVLKLSDTQEKKDKAILARELRFNKICN